MDLTVLGNGKSAAKKTGVVVKIVLPVVAVLLILAAVLGYCVWMKRQRTDDLDNTDKEIYDLEGARVSQV